MTTYTYVFGCLGNCPDFRIPISRRNRVKLYPSLLLFATDPGLAEIPNAPETQLQPS